MLRHFRVLVVTIGILFSTSACSGVFGFNKNYSVGSGGAGGTGTPGCNYTEYVNYVLSLNLVGYWKLEDTAGTTAADSSGNHDVGTFANVKTGVTPGPFSCATNHPAMSFSDNGSDATNSKIITATSFSNPLTYSEIVMFKASGYGTLTSFDDSGPNCNRVVYVGSDRKLYTCLYHNGDECLSSSGSVVDGQWHIAVATESGAGLYLYLDGHLAASNADYTAPNNITGTWDIGWCVNWGWPNQDSPTFDGWMAQVAVTYPALTKEQVTTLAKYSGLYH